MCTVEFSVHKSNKEDSCPAGVRRFGVSVWGWRHRHQLCVRSCFYFCAGSLPSVCGEQGLRQLCGLLQGLTAATWKPCVCASPVSQKAVLGGAVEFGWKEWHFVWCRDLLIQGHVISIKPNLFKWLQLFRDRLTSANLLTHQESDLRTSCTRGTMWPQRVRTLG